MTREHGLLFAAALASSLTMSCTRVGSGGERLDSGEGAVYYDGQTSYPNPWDTDTNPWDTDTKAGSSPADITPQPSIDGGGTAPAGSLSCTDITVCINTTCQEDETACFDGCVSKGTGEAKAAYSAVANCEDQAVGGSCASSCASYTAACGACLDGACPTEHASCGYVQTCAQGDQCLAGCGQDDMVCVETCYSKLTDADWVLLDSLDECFYNAYQTCSSHCQDPNSESCWSCVDPKCTAAMQACGVSC